MPSVAVPLPSHVPPAIRQAAGADAGQRLLGGCSGADVFRLAREDGTTSFLKVQLCNGDVDGHPLRRERDGVRWLRERADHGDGVDDAPPRLAGVLGYEEANGDPRVGRWAYLLTSAVPGTPLHLAMADTPLRVARLAGLMLRWLHDLPAEDALPRHDVAGLLAIAERHVETGVAGSRLSVRGERPEHAKKRLKRAAKRPPADVGVVVTHFDYCLPNVLAGLDDRVGLIDVGGLCLADRHLDLACGLRSLRYNGARKDACRTFLRWYGEDAVDPKRLSWFSELCDLL